MTADASAIVANIIALHAPGRRMDTVPRFYITIDAPRLSGALFGMAVVGMRGTWKTYRSAELAEKVRKRLSETYTHCHEGDIPLMARQHLAARMRTAHQLPQTWAATFVRDADGHATHLCMAPPDAEIAIQPAAGTAPDPARPRSRQRLRHGWF